MKNQITNIRYANDGKVSFEFGQKTIYIKEPKDVILVGTDNQLASSWIIKHYGFLLQFVN